jgi:hypothetical protein
MDDEYVVVIKDTGSPRQFLRCLREVSTTVRPDVEIIAVSKQFPRLGGLTRRVRRVQVRSGESLDQVARAEAVPDRYTVVARSQCRLQTGWLDALLRRMPVSTVGFAVLGHPAPWLEVYSHSPTGLAPAPVDLEMVPGIELPTARPVAAPPVTISACLIVKDEEQNIERCLAAVSPLVDEVIVYDTGSADRTVERAEASGAIVVRGYWDDDFGAARNRSLEHCTGDWILQVDADEVVEGDPEALRWFVRGAQDDLARVTLVNVSWDGADDGEKYVVERLFRRAAGRWHGALHERIVARGSQRPLRVAESMAPLRLLHLGYTADRLEAKAKGERNVAIASKQLATGSVTAATWCDYGRSLTLAGQHSEAVDALDHLLDMTVPNTMFVLGGRAALQSLAALESGPDRVERWLGALAVHGEAPGRVDLERARLWLRHGDVSKAAAAVDTLSSAPDCWGIAFNEDEAAGVRAELLFRQGQPVESYRSLVAAVSRRLESVALPALLLSAMRASVSFEDVCQDVPQQFVTRSFREVLHIDAENADAWLDAVWRTLRDHRALVAAGIVCRGLGIGRVLVWETRCMETGTAISPLRAIATDNAASASSRCLAHAVLADVLGVAGSHEAAATHFALTPASEQDALLFALAQYAPGLVRYEGEGAASVAS